jgi:hypothetical protein
MDYRNAVNHNGWNVEVLTLDGRGWVVQAGPYEDKDFAKRVCEIHKETIPESEFRVYEALK